MKNLTKALVALLFTLANYSSTSFANPIMLSPVDFGNVLQPQGEITSFKAGNLYENSPAVQALGPSYDQHAIVEFDILTFSAVDSYFLVLSPWSIYAGNEVTDQAWISFYNGNGQIELADWGNGTPYGLFPITFPHSPNCPSVDIYGWCLNGNTDGDTLIDVTSIVTQYMAASTPFLGFDISTIVINDNYTGVLFRRPYILAFSAEVAPSPDPTIPEPGILFMISLGFACLGWIRRNGPSIKS